MCIKLFIIILIFQVILFPIKTYTPMEVMNYQIVLSTQDVLPLELSGQKIPLQIVQQSIRQNIRLIDQNELLSIGKEVNVNKVLMNSLYEGATVVERNLGIPALFQVAQAIEESGWDLTPIPDSFNIFGIKWEHYGDYVESWTKEWSNGKYIDVLAKFQKYKSFAECFSDHARLLSSTEKGNQAYSYLNALNQFKIDKNVEMYVTKVSKIYATSPTYAIQILDIMDSLKKIFAIDLTSAYEIELTNAKTTMVRLGIITDFNQKEVNVERLAVILARLIIKVTST